MFKSNKDKEVTIPLNMKYIYSGEWYDKILITKRRKPADDIKISTENGKLICSIDTGNELKIVLQTLINGDWQ